MTSDNQAATNQSPTSDLPVRPDLLGARPYGAPHPAVAVRLNMNENPYPPPSDQVVEAMVRRLRLAAADLNRYPDRDFPTLRAGLAAYLASESAASFLTAENIWAANGSNEVMQHLFLAFGGPGRTALSFNPTYSMYPQYARDSHTTYLTGPRRSDYTIDPDQAISLLKQSAATILVLASPNNPTGTALPLEVVDQLSSQAQGQAVVVVDEAYAEFRQPGCPSAITLLPKHPNLVVTRTMSKAFSLAGLRLGYAAANPEVIGYLRTVRLPYHLSTITQACALAALDHAPALLEQVASLRGARDQLRNQLLGLGLTVPESAANFLAVGRFTDPAWVFQQLLDQGIVVRNTGQAGFLRVTIGTPDQNEAFWSVLTGILDGQDLLELSDWEPA